MITFFFFLIFRNRTLSQYLVLCKRVYSTSKSIFQVLTFYWLGLNHETIQNHPTLRLQQIIRFDLHQISRCSIWLQHCWPAFTSFTFLPGCVCVHTANLIETLEIKASIRLDELVTSHPAPAAGLTTLLHSLGNEVNHVENGPKDWRHL